MEYGEQCVVICGEEQMQLWCAGNLDTPVQVSSYNYSKGIL